MNDTPLGIAVEIEFMRPDKPNERGLLAGAVDYEARGFELVVPHVPDGLGFHEPFRLEWRRKWVNLATVAELRYLPDGTLEEETARMKGIHDGVRSRMGARPRESDAR